MSTYVYMKVLEGAAERYDQGIQRLSAGRIDTYYNEIAHRACSPGARVLDVGCGTGGLTLACAAHGVEIVGIDLNPDMLEVARRKPVPRDARVEWVEIGAMEIEDRFPEASFDAIVSCLMFSELLAEEQEYVLATAYTRLRPGGTIVIGDEAIPDSRAARILHKLRRLPAVAVTYLSTQKTTRPVAKLATKLRDAGFERVAEESFDAGTFLVAQGWKAK